MSVKTRAIIVEIISVLIIVLFYYAAFIGILKREQIETELKKTPLLISVVPLSVWGIPIADVAIAILLVFRTTRLTGLYLSLFLLILFTTYIIIILNFSYYIPCPCIGIIKDLSWKGHLVFNSGYLVLIVIGIMIQTNTSKQ